MIVAAIFDVVHKPIHKLGTFIKLLNGEQIANKVKQLRKQYLHCSGADYTAYDGS